jgi:hypothetical protein
MATQRYMLLEVIHKLPGAIALPPIWLRRCVSAERFELSTAVWLARWVGAVDTAGSVGFEVQLHHKNRGF